MRGKAHVYISAFLCQFFALIVFKDLSPAPLIIGSIFGIIADIDEDQSKISYLLIKRFGGTKRIGGVNHHKTDTKYNSMLKKARQTALTAVLLGIGIALYLLSKKNLYFTLLCVYISILPWTRHRSLSHSLLSCIIVGVCCYLSFNLYGLPKYGIYCGVGYSLHIFEDGFTVSGVPLFYPFSKKKYKIPLMKTGSDKGAKVEFMFRAVSFCAFIITYLYVLFKM